MYLKVCTAVAALAISAVTMSPVFADSYTLQGDKDTGLIGVSPFAMNVSGETDRVFYSGGLSGGGWSVSLCTASSNCTGAPLPFGFGTDYTQVTLADGSMRAYFIQPMAGAKSIATASVTYNAAGIPQLGSALNLGFTSPPGQKAWGVPDSVVLPDGRVRLYWVSMPTEPVAATKGPTKKQIKCLAKVVGKKRVQTIGNGATLTAKDKKALKRCKVPQSSLTNSASSRSTEVIVSATSSDASGTQFVLDSGYRFTGGYVDSDVIQATDGNWIALVSTGPGTPPQRLYAATSRDGLTWSVDTNALTPTTVNSLDPSAVPTGPNSWRVYYSVSPAADPFNNYKVVVGTLTRK
jgi:hypothetical protein